MKIPGQIVPTLRKVSASQSAPLEFWQLDDGRRIMDCFSELAAQLAVSDIDVSSLPKGYRLSSLLFQWENECQAEGWNAFDWTPNIKQVVEAYAEVGLSREGKAIERAADTWARSPDDYAAVTAAYEQEKSEAESDFDRLEYLVDYFCERSAEMFYES